MNYLVLILALAIAGAGCTKPAAAPPAINVALPMIQCAEQFLPEFRLGADPALSDQQGPICDCIWSRLSARDRQVAARLRKEQRINPSSNDAFAIAFGRAIGECSPSAR